MTPDEIRKKRERSLEKKIALEKIANECYEIFRRNVLTVGDVNTVLKICENKTLTSKVN